MKVDIDEWVGYSRAARNEDRASKPDRVIRRLHHALLQSTEGRSISMDRVSLAASERAQTILKAIATRRHRRNTSSFVGWYAFPVLGINALRPIALSVLPVPLRANPFHSELRFPRDMRADHTNRKVVIDDLMELGRWHSAS